MVGDRKIDDRDIDKLLLALSDRQIAGLYDIEESEVFRLRKLRRQRLEGASGAKTKPEKPLP